MKGGWRNDDLHPPRVLLGSGRLSGSLDPLIGEV
jgi:hypothetical protein